MKKLPYWKSGAIIGGCLYITLAIITLWYALADLSSCSGWGCYFGPGIPFYLLNFPAAVLLEPFFGFYPTFVLIILSLAFYTLIGAVVGDIIGRIRRGKKQKV